MNFTILIVDDEEGIRKVLGISLMDMGYKVFTASSGEEALSTHKQEAPEIVITDIKMPGISGIELLRKIKRENADTEVIMITGHGDMALAIECIKNDAVDFITKPVNDDILDIALNRAKDRISSRNQIRNYTKNLERLVEEKSAKILEMERLSAIGQAYEGFTSAVRNLTGDLSPGLKYLNEIPFFVAIYDNSLKIASTNQLYKERIRDSIGLHFSDIYMLPSDGRVSSLESSFLKGVPLKSEETFKDINGDFLPVFVYTVPIRKKDGAIEFILEISVDITEIKKLQSDLFSVRQKFKQLFNEAPCYISVQNRDLEIIETNRLFREDFDNNKGRKCYEVYKRRDEKCEDCPVVKTFEDGLSHHLETTVTSATGKTCHVLIRTAPVFDDNGDIRSVMEMSTNITEIRNLQDHLSSLGLLVSAISHGVKGLLTGIDGGIYLTNQGISDENIGNIKEGWRIVLNRVGKIKKMVMDILYYAKERELSLVKKDVFLIADDISGIVEPKMKEKGIVFIKRYDKSSGIVEVDPVIFQSAIINILENAIDACMEDVSSKDHEIIFEVKESGHSVIFRIEDNGTGIEEDLQEDIFTIFYSSKKNKGTGLGLFITEKIVTEHGGSIKLISEKGVGSTFIISIPVT